MLDLLDKDGAIIDCLVVEVIAVVAEIADGACPVVGLLYTVVHIVNDVCVELIVVWEGADAKKVCAPIGLVAVACPSGEGDLDGLSTVS